MTERWRAQIREWLIDLVREAIRLELRKYCVVMPTDFADMFSRRSVPATPTRPASKPPTTSPLSFEQEEREALKSQEKYYAPAE